MRRIAIALLLVACSKASRSGAGSASAGPDTAPPGMVASATSDSATGRSGHDASARDGAAFDASASSEATAADGGDGGAGASASTRIRKKHFRPPRCDGPHERLYGVTCCSFTRIMPEDPGSTIVSCHGPQLGQPCAKASDCDINCLCDAHGQRATRRSGPRGPKDGTRGIVGECGGMLERGVWRCIIDDKGRVTHKIID